MTNKLPYDEKEILLQVAAGDEQAFATLFIQYQDELKPFLHRYTQSWTDTKDVLQKTFIRVWLSRDKLPAIHNFHAWIFKVASREYLRYLRQKVRQQQQNTIPVQEETEVFLQTITPQDELQTSELKKMVHEAIDRLPEQRRLIFRLSRTEGMKIADIAHQLDISPNTVKNALTTALRQIREYLAERGYTISFLYLILMSY